MLLEKRQNNHMWHYIVPMSIVRVSTKHSIVIGKDVRKSIPIKIGQEVLEIPLGDTILLVPLSSEPDKKLQKYLFPFSRKLRREAEARMMKEVTKF